MPRRSKHVIVATIQDVTISLFGAKTYNEITMNEIAQRAGIAKQTLYKYFPSKIVLFASIFERYLQMLANEQSEESFEGKDYGESLRMLLQSLYDFTEKNRGFMRLFWMLNSDTADGEIPEELLRHIHYWNSRIVDRTANMLRQKDTGGLFKKYSPELITHALSAINKGIYLQATKEESFRIEHFNKNDLFSLFCDMLEYCAKS